MKTLIQRVSQAKLHVDQKLISQIGNGLVVYLGVAQNDDASMCQYLAKKIAHMRIFEDENGKMNLSTLDTNSQILVVSQFTLYADAKEGNRPSFSQAEKPQKANQMYLYFVECLKTYGIDVKTGVFGADMKICQTNDGPVSIILEN